MRIIFWLSFTVMFFVYFGYPALIFILASLNKTKSRKENIEPAVSIIFPLHNEEKVIRYRLENTLCLEYPEDKFEIIFALDNCTDKTKQIISEFNNPRVKVYEYNSRAGKVETLNKTVAKAKGEIIIFSDANTIHKNDTIRKIVRNFADPKVGCVCGRLTYTESEQTLVSRGENLYWQYEHFIKKQESRLGMLLITNGSLQAVRKSLYPYPDPDIADDLSIPIMIRAKGYKVIYEHKARVYEVATQCIKEEFSQKVRIISQGLKGAVRLRGQIMRTGAFGIFQFFAHKLLRWMMAFFMAGMLISCIPLANQPFYGAFLGAQVIFYLCALIGFIRRTKNKIKIFYIPFYFCLVNLAAMAALLRFIRQGETRIWDKAHTTRIAYD